MPLVQYYTYGAKLKGLYLIHTIHAVRLQFCLLIVFFLSFLALYLMPPVQHDTYCAMLVTL